MRKHALTDSIRPVLHECKATQRQHKKRQSSKQNPTAYLKVYSLGPSVIYLRNV